MTYTAFETSLESGDPVELYKFEVGGVDFLRTSSQEDFVVNIPDPLEGTYVATALSRSAVNQAAGRSQNGALDVTILASDPIVTRYIVTPPGQRALLTIIRIHRSDPDEETIIYWQGEIRSIQFKEEGREAKLLVDQFTSAHRRQIPRFTFSATCNHTHYDARCKVDKDDPAFRKDLAVTSESGNVYTVSTAGSFGANFFVAGYMEFNGDFRSIAAQAGDLITVNLPFSESLVGQVAFLRAGCKLRIAEDCDAKFSNAINFGGFPYIPVKNPFESLD